jgi:hypothetical protein
MSKPKDDNVTVEPLLRFRLPSDDRAFFPNRQYTVTRADADKMVEANVAKIVEPPAGTYHRRDMRAKP